MSGPLYRLHVIEAAGEDYVEVWLDRGDCTGICVGQDATPEAALVQARVELAHAIEKVDQHIARLQHPTGASRSQWEGGG